MQSAFSPERVDASAETEGEILLASACPALTTNLLVTTSDLKGPNAGTPGTLTAVERQSIKACRSGPYPYRIRHQRNILWASPPWSGIMAEGQVGPCSNNVKWATK